MSKGNRNQLRQVGTNPARDAMFMQGKPTRAEVSQFFEQRFAGQILPIIRNVEANLLNQIGTFAAASQIGLQVCQAIMLKHNICSKEELDAVTREYAQLYQQQIALSQQQNENLKAYFKNPCADTISVLTDEQIQGLATEYRVSIEPYDRQRVIDTLLNADTSHDGQPQVNAEPEDVLEDVDDSPEAIQAETDTPCEVLQFPGTATQSE